MPSFGLGRPADAGTHSMAASSVQLSHSLQTMLTEAHIDFPDASVLVRPTSNVLVQALLSRNFEDIEGKEVGSFKMVKLAHAGHNTVTFLAQSLIEERVEVAAKFLLPQATAQMRMRYLREYITAKFVSLDDEKDKFELFELGGGIVFYTMPYVAGHNIKTVYAQGKVGIPDRVILWMISVLQALQRAHKLGVVHSDINFGNIVIKDDKLSTHLYGWGYARYLFHIEKGIFEALPPSEQRLLESTASDGKGTAAAKIVAAVGLHTAPEVLMGDVEPQNGEQRQHGADQRTDLYSLAASMAFALGARFDRTYQLKAARMAATFCEAAQRHERTTSLDARPLHDFVSHGILPSGPLFPDGLPLARQAAQQVEAVFRRALQPDPRKRYRNIHEMLADILTCNASPRFSVGLHDDDSTVVLMMELLNNAGLMHLRTELMRLIRCESYPGTPRVVLVIKDVDEMLNPDDLQTTADLLMVLSHATEVKIVSNDGEVGLELTEVSDSWASTPKLDGLLCALYFSNAIHVKTLGVTEKLCGLLGSSAFIPLRELVLDGVPLTSQMFLDVMEFVSPKSKVSPILDTLSLCRIGKLTHQSCMALSLAIRHNDKLHVLKLDNNGILSAGAIVIANALQANQFIQDFSAEENPFTAEVVADFVKAQVLVPGRVVRIHWMALRLDLAAPGYPKGFLVGRLTEFGQREIVRLVRSDEVGKNDTVANVFGSLEETAKQVIASFQEIFSLQGYPICDKDINVFSEDYIKTHHVPTPILRFARMPMPISLVLVAVQAPSGPMLEILQIVRAFYDTVVKVHPRPVHAALQYACLLEFVAQFHRVVAEPLKREATSFKCIASAIFRELPLAQFETLALDEELTELALEIWCVEISQESRFQYLIDRLWTGAQVFHADNQLEQSKKAAGGKFLQNAKRPVLELIRGVGDWSRSPRFIFYLHAASYLFVNLILHYAAYWNQTFFKDRHKVRMMFSVKASFVLYTVCCAVFTAKIPNAVIQVRRDMEPFANWQSKALLDALHRPPSRALTLRSMYQESYRREFFCHIANLCDVIASCLFILLMGVWFTGWSDEDLVACIAVSMLLLWARLTSFIIMWPHCAYMIVQMLQIMVDVFYWAVIFVIWLGSFSLAIFALGEASSCVGSVSDVAQMLIRATFFDWHEELDCLIEEINENRDMFLVGFYLSWCWLVSPMLIFLVFGVFLANFQKMGPSARGQINLRRLREMHKRNNNAKILALPPPLNLFMLVYAPFYFYRRYQQRHAHGVVKGHHCKVEVRSRDKEMQNRSNVPFIPREGTAASRKPPLYRARTTLHETLRSLSLDAEANNVNANHRLHEQLSAEDKDYLLTSLQQISEQEERITQKRSREIEEAMPSHFKSLRKSSLLMYQHMSTKAVPGEALSRITNMREFSIAFASLLAEMALDCQKSAHTGPVGEDILQQLLENPVASMFKGWFDHFIDRDAHGPRLRWNAMRVSLLTFREVIAPLWDFGTISSVIGEERGVSMYEFQEKFLNLEESVRWAIMKPAQDMRKKSSSSEGLKALAREVEAVSEAVSVLTDRVSHTTSFATDK